MAKKPSDAVQFTFESAERIANVVRAAETSPRVGSPLRFLRQLPLQIPRQVRPGTFTGLWSTGQLKTVTLSRVPTATVSVQNLTMHLPFTHTQNCIVGKEGTAWYLVDAPDEPVKRGTFTAPWSKSASTTVTIAQRGTVSAINDYANITGSGTKKCTVARDGTAWHLIAAECS